MENYLMLNGKRIDLTAEQIETLVGKKEKDPFEMGEQGDTFYYITAGGYVGSDSTHGYCNSDALFEVANYCTDKELMEQRALHKVLDDLLFRFSMKHGGRDSKNRLKWTISCDGTNPYFWADCQHNFFSVGAPRFLNQEAAKAAIEEIVKPFMEKHPEFRW